MADAPDSKSGPRKGVWVQVPPSVLTTQSGTRTRRSSRCSVPNLDEITSARIDAPRRRGLLATALVVVMGEMAGDHWPRCGFARLIGGVVKSGFVLGPSDEVGA